MMSDVEKLVRREPWRRGQGQPRNALDSTWTVERSRHCDGQPVFVDNQWWYCNTCGYCDNQYLTFAHAPVDDPIVFLMREVEAFLAQRQQQGLDRELAIKQACHIASVALRYAGSKDPTSLQDYVKHLIVP
jgi:hypothetical protein